MSLLRCVACNGSGKLMGGGMIYHDCEHCDGSGKINDGDITLPEIKNSKGYKEAVGKIQALDDNLTREDAEKIFDEQFSKVKYKPRKKKYGGKDETLDSKCTNI